MSSALRKSFLKLALNSIKTNHANPSYASLKHLNPSLVCARGLNSSLSCVSSVFRSRKHNAATSAVPCRQVQTEADSKLGEFLSEEISREKETVPEVISKVEGWEVETDGAGVILRKKFNDERFADEGVKVEFDVNDSVDSGSLYDAPPEAEGGSEVPPMVSRPPFEVEIKKKSGRTLTFMCEFTAQEPPYEGQNEEGIEDQFQIVEVRVDQPSETGTIENFYSHSSAVMDGNLYEMLMDMLDERGIDDNFINKMVDFATSYEQQQYLNFLQKLRDVIQEK
ncbi:complement component 1 Q subcomponent-binding protein, mitochondrial-like isoform X1 [Mya arenaria]|uniref:complement component 1 Q subcomponent-binding protein, mitochondrial-like isoform X1 n=1 Tax=Mya arenaria TaxID=6604 RepID=UPI0022E3B5D7|nr:complement component 1 Q subcomponent-binding protein, mitochondrial-like isoform X1 [Mya arenaria]